MEINLRRHVAVGDATIGTMTIGDFTCYTLEDVIRDTKVWGKTAIPAGIYPVLMTESPRFTESYEKKGLGRIVPLLDGVPEYTGVRIHVGNVAEHSHGCILVGDDWDQKSARITGSASAFKRMMKALNAATGSHRITIVNDIGEAKVKLSHPPAPLFNMMYARSCFPA
ncbi:DUF5675 family protein [Roseomonas sp. F4]